MINISFSSSFKRAFKRKIKGNIEREKRFWDKLEIFQKTPLTPRLELTNYPANLKTCGVSR